MASRFMILILISIKLTRYTKDASNCFLIKTFFFAFLKACDSIILGKYPAPDTTLYLLAALRLQFNEGDYKPGAWV